MRFNYHSQMSQLTVTHPTHWGEGDHLRARPMAVRPVPEEGALYFLTDADAPKSEEIERNDNICIALANTEKQKYVSITTSLSMRWLKMCALPAPKLFDPG